MNNDRQIYLEKVKQCSEEIYSIPIEYITYELLDIVCNDIKFLETKDFTILLDGFDTDQAIKLYKNYIFKKAYFNVYTTEMLAKFNIDEKCRDYAIQYCIQDLMSKLQVLINNFKNDDYSESLVKLICLQSQFKIFVVFAKGYRLFTAETDKEKMKILLEIQTEYKEYDDIYIENLLDDDE